MTKSPTFMAVFSQHILLALFLLLVLPRAQCSSSSFKANGVSKEAMDSQQHQHQQGHWLRRGGGSLELHNYYVIHMQRYHQIRNAQQPAAAIRSQGEKQQDPTSSNFVAEKRLVPTGPNPLHN